MPVAAVGAEFYILFLFCCFTPFNFVINLTYSYYYRLFVYFISFHFVTFVRRIPKSVQEDEKPCDPTYYEMHRLTSHQSRIMLVYSLINFS